MDNFEPPGDPGDPGDIGAHPETQAKDYVVDTATQREKVIQPEMVEHQRNANGTNSSMYKKGTHTTNDKDINEDKEASIIDLLL